VTKCACTEIHPARRIVLTGGPGAGKTAVLGMMGRTLCEHVKVVPEAAGVVFGGGFPRGDAPAVRIAGQRAIFFLQRELEAAVAAENVSIALCDRGTVDGLAYWSGNDDLWRAVGTTLPEQLARYHAVIHLRTATTTRIHCAWNLQWRRQRSMHASRPRGQVTLGGSRFRRRLISSRRSRRWSRSCVVNCRRAAASTQSPSWANGK
jgi:predicted ATPase